MSYKLLINVDSKLAKKNVLPLDQQGLGTFTEAEKELMRKQAEQARKLQEENDRREGKKTESNNADPQKVALDQMDGIIKSNADRSFFDFQMLVHQGQELRKATNRMQGLADDENKYHLGVTARQITMLNNAMPGLKGCARTEEEKAEVNALEAELKALDEENMEWFRKQTVRISAEDELDETGATTGAFMPEEMGDRLLALYDKIIAQIQKQRARLDREHPEVKDGHRPDVYDQERNIYNSVESFLKSVKDSRTFYECFDKNLYFRNNLQTQNVGASLLGGDKQKYAGTPPTEEDSERVGYIYEVLPIRQYYQQMAKMAVLNDEVNQAYAAAVKAEQDALAKNGSDDLEAVKMVIKPYVDAYKTKRNELISEGAKLDGLYEKIKANSQLLSSEEQLAAINITALRSDIKSISRSFGDDHGGSNFSVGTRLKENQRRHEDYQDMISRGWVPEQANILEKCYSKLSFLIDEWEDSSYAPPGSLDAEFRRLTDDFARLKRTNPGTGEGLTERIDGIRDRLSIIMDSMKDKDVTTIGTEGRNISIEDFNIIGSEINRVFNHKGGLVEDAMFMDTSAVKLREDKRKESVYTAAQQKADTQYLMEKIPGLVIDPEKMLKEEDAPEVDQEENPEKKPEENPEDKPQEKTEKKPGDKPEEDDLEENLNINSLFDQAGEEKEPEKEEEIPEEEPVQEEPVQAAVELDPRVKEKISEFVKGHPFEMSALNIEGAAQQEIAYEYHAIQRLKSDEIVLADEKLTEGFLNAAAADQAKIMEMRTADGKHLDEAYADSAKRMATGPEYAKMDALFAEKYAKAVEDFGDMEGLSPEQKDLMLSARAVELVGAEIANSENRADRDLFEKTYMTLQGRLNRERLDDGSRLTSVYDRLKGEAEERERVRAEQERIRREEEERRIAAEQRRASEAASMRKVKDAFEKGAEEPKEKSRVYFSMVSPGQRITKYTAPKREIEKVNSVDINRLSFYIGDILMRVGDKISDERKNEIREKLGNLNSRIPEMALRQTPSKGSGMATNIEWLSIPKEYSEEVKEVRVMADELTKALDQYINDQNDVTKHDPIAVYYSDYLKCIRGGRSYFANVQGDGVYERLVSNTLGAITPPAGQFDFEKIRKDLKDFPLLPALSKANAMHRMLEDESLEIDGEAGAELVNRRKMIALAKSLEQDLLAMDKFDENRYKTELQDTGILQANQRGNLKLGAGRGFQKAYRENSERIKALEHNWLVRDLPMISRLGDLSESMKACLARDDEERKKGDLADKNKLIPEDQREQMKAFSKMFEDGILNNRLPMTAENRKTLIAGIGERLINIKYPPVVRGLQLEAAGSTVNEQTMKTGDKVMAAMTMATVAMINKTFSRKLSLSEQQTMNLTDGTVKTLFSDMQNKWDAKNMPSEPFWHKANRAGDPYSNMRSAWEELQTAVNNAEDKEHPERDPKVIQAAGVLKEAAEAYMEAKNVQKKLDTKRLNTRELRKANKEKRGDFGQYRYNLADSMRTAAGILIKTGQKPTLMNLAKPKSAGVDKGAAANDLTIESFKKEYNLVLCDKKSLQDVVRVGHALQKSVTAVKNNIEIIGKSKSI